MQVIKCRFAISDNKYCSFNVEGTVNMPTDLVKYKKGKKNQCMSHILCLKVMLIFKLCLLPVLWNILFLREESTSSMIE